MFDIKKYYIFCRGILGGAAVFFAFSFILSSEITSYSEQASNDLVFELISLTYPAKISNSVIIFVDDNSISGFDTFPLKMSSHAKYLDDILSFNPSALVIDFLFLDDRIQSDVLEFKNSIQRYSLAGIPVFFPIVPSNSLPFGIRRDLVELFDLDRVIPTSAVLGKEIYGTHSYTPTSNESIQTIAFSLSKHLSPSLESIASSRGNFQIWWPGYASSANYSQLFEQYPKETSLLLRLLGIVNPRILESELAKYSSILAPYQPTLKVEQLAFGIEKEVLRNLIQNKVVFYAGNFLAATDTHRNPIFTLDAKQNSINGVYFHATAFDNIVDLRGNTLAVVSTELEYIYIGIAVFIMLIVGIPVGYSVFAEWLARIILFVSMPLLSLSFCIIALFNFHVAPSNWIGISFVFNVGIILSSGDMLSSKAMNTFHGIKKIFRTIGKNK